MAEGVDNSEALNSWQRILADNWARSWKPRDRRPIYEWARENVFLPSRLTRTGAFEVDRSRQFIAPFDALQNDRIREVNILAPVRDGKTLIADVWLPWLIVNSPGPFRWVFADDNQASDQEEERVKPILSTLPGYGQFVPRGKLANIAGMVAVIDGPALGKLQARGYQFMVLDEPWMWASGKLHEAKERQKDFRKLGSNKLLVISQGGSEKCEDWKDQYHLGVVHEWNVQCQGCGKFMAPVWSGFREDGSRWGMRWDEFKEPNGLWNAPKAATTARFECFHCGFAHVDTPLLKQRWNQTGKYVAEASEKNDQKVSFHWNGIATYLFAELVELYLNALNQRKHGSSKALVVFFQKQMAEFSTEHTINQAAIKFITERYEANSDWPDEDGRLMTMDQQIGNVLYVTVRQWSAKARQCRRIYRGVVHGEAAALEIQKRFNVPPHHVIGDSGFDPKGPGRMYSMAIRNGWLCAKGVGTPDGKARPEIFRTVRRGGKSARVHSTYADLSWGDPDTGTSKRAPLQRYDSDAVSQLLEDLIKSGFWVEPVNDGGPEEKDYREQMAAEYKNEEGKWECPSGRNHYRDTARLQILGALLKGWIQDPMDNETEGQKKA